MRALLKKLLLSYSSDSSGSERDVDEQPAYEKLQIMTGRFYRHANKFFFYGSSLIGLALLLLLIFMLHHQDSSLSDLSVHDNEHTNVVLNQLENINSQLQQLANNPVNSKQVQAALLNITQDIAVVKAATLKDQIDLKNVSQQVISMHTDVNSQMEEMRNTLANNISKHYLDSHLLPFQVLSVDVISGQPFVSINYAHHITPLMVGDSLAGWQITAADYASGVVEFKNAKDQYIQISLAS